MDGTLEDSQPVELYEFVTPYQTYRYTSDKITQSVSGNSYEPIAGLTRSNFKIGTQDDDRDEIKVSMPVSTQVAQDWGFEATPPELKMTITRIDRAGGSPVPLWVGPVNSINIKKNIAEFRCLTRFSNILQDNLPTLMVQNQCNHVLFDSRCKVSRAANSFTANVTNVNGREITLDVAGPFADSRLISGEVLVLSTGERRTIVSKSGTLVTVNYAMNVNVSDSVELASGCDHGWFSDCVNLYNNQVNYGGFPFLKGESANIFRNGIQ